MQIRKKTTIQVAQCSQSSGKFQWLFLAMYNRTMAIPKDQKTRCVPSCPLGKQNWCPVNRLSMTEVANRSELKL